MSRKGFCILFIAGYNWTHALTFILEHGKPIPVELVPASVLFNKPWEVIENARIYFITDDDIFFQA